MQIPINPKILHKSSRDDVLISNPSIPLPEYLDAELLKECGPESDQILKLYHSDAGNRLRFGKPQAQSQLIEAEKHADNLREGKRWLDLRAIPFQIACGICGNEMSDGDELRKHAAKFVESINRSHRSSSYTFINDASHYFFYRKTHDHVPGIMMVEAQRQAIYHHFYSNSGWELGQVTVSLNNLQANFYDYANLMYPIEIVVDDLASAQSKRPRKISYRVSFYQRKKLISVIDTDATVITIDNFRKIRNMLLPANEWFVPIDNLISCTVSPPSTNNESETELKVSISAVSKTGIRLSESENNQISASEIRVRIANADGKTFIAEAVLDKEYEREFSWRFKDMNSDDLLTLGMIISSGCVSDHF